MDSLHSVRAENVTAIYQLLDGIFRNQPGAAGQRVRTDFPLFFAADNLRNRRVIRCGDQTICHAGIWPRVLTIGTTRLKTGVIVLVATHPAHRRRGLAARCMLSLQRQLKTEHYDLGILWTGVPGFYEPLGWRIARPSGDYLPRTGAARPFLLQQMEQAAPFRLQNFDAEHHLQGVMELQRQHPVRMLRSVSDFRQLLALPKIQVWVVQRETVDAYLVAGQAVNKRGILEYGGSTSDILAGIGALLRAGRLDEETPLPIFGSDSKLAEHLRSAGILLAPLESSKGQGTEMRLVLDSQRLTASHQERLFVWGLDWA